MIRSDEEEGVIDSKRVLFNNISATSHGLVKKDGGGIAMDDSDNRMDRLTC